MDNSIVVALISGGFLVLAGLVALLGVIISRRSDKADDTREWVSLRMDKQDREIAQLNGDVAELKTELRKERAANRTAERRTVSVVGYVREVLAWIGLHYPNERPPAPHGLAREVLRNE